MKTLGNERKRSFIRLKKSSDFQLVLGEKGDNSFSCYSKWFESKLLLRGSLSCLSVGFTVGKRFAVRSVDRNLVKRILRESVRNADLKVKDQGDHGDVSKLVIRLKRKLPRAGKDIALITLKRKLREDADTLLVRLKVAVEEKSSAFKENG